MVSGNRINDAAPRVQPGRASLTQSPQFLKDALRTEMPQRTNVWNHTVHVDLWTELKAGPAGQGVNTIGIRLPLGQITDRDKDTAATTAAVLLTDNQLRDPTEIYAPAFGSRIDDLVTLGITWIGNLLYQGKYGRGSYAAQVALTDAGISKLASTDVRTLRGTYEQSLSDMKLERSRAHVDSSTARFQSIINAAKSVEAAKSPSQKEKALEVLGHALKDIGTDIVDLTLGISAINKVVGAENAYSQAMLENEPSQFGPG